MNNYSPNMLKTFDECQQKFFLKYIQKLSVPQPSYLFEKGKKIHALANYYLRGENVEKLEKVLNVDEKIAWEALKSNKYFKLKVLNTEYNLSCKVGKYWVGGRLDAFMVDSQMQPCHAELVSASNQQSIQEKSRNEFGVTISENIPEYSSSHLSPLTSHYFILDYKTGNIPADAGQDFQTIVYLLSADKYLQKHGGYKSLKFVYLGLKQDVEKEILFSEELKKQYEEKIIKTCEKIDFAITSNSSNVFSKNAERCKTCEYKKLCSVETNL